MRFRRAARALLGEATTFIIGVKIASIAAVVSGQARVDLMGADDHRPGVGPALDHSTDKRRHGQTPLGVHRGQRAPVEEMLQFHGREIPLSKHKGVRSQKRAIALPCVPTRRTEVPPPRSGHSG